MATNFNSSHATPSNVLFSWGSGKSNYQSDNGGEITTVLFVRNEPDCYVRLGEIFVGYGAIAYTDELLAKAWAAYQNQQA